METRRATLPKWFNLLAVIVIIGVAQPLLLSADDLYQLSWRGIAYTVGPRGQVVARRFSEKDFLQQIAQNNGISDSRSLVFVYRPDKHDTAVMWVANGGFVADVIQMENQYTEVSNTNQTMTVRQAFLFDEGHDLAIGSAFGTERAKRNANGDLLSYSFRGTFQYSLPESDAVYSGTFSTGRRVKDTSGQ